MSDAVSTGASRPRGSTRPKWKRVLCRLPAVASVLAAVPIALSVEPSPSEAKAPGVSHCYRRVCHHVKTVEQTRRMIGRSFAVETSYYDLPGIDRFNTGTYTSNGERFDANDPARVASADLPDGTELLLRNPINGRVSHVRVNDFGPFRGNRRLDVTRRVAEDLDFRHKGVVRLDVIVIAAPEEDDLTYRRNRERRATRGHLGVVFEGELSGLVSDLVADRTPNSKTSTLIASIEPGPAETAAREPPNQLEKTSERQPDRFGEAQLARVAYDDAPDQSVEGDSEALPSSTTEPDVVLYAEAADVATAEVHAALPDLREADQPGTTPVESHPIDVVRVDEPAKPHASALVADAERVADAPVSRTSPSGMQMAGFVSTAGAASETGASALAISANRNLLLVLLAGLMSTLLAASLAQNRRFSRTAIAPLPVRARSPRLSSMMARSPADAPPAASVSATEAAVTVSVAQPVPTPADRAVSRIAAHFEIEGTLRSSGRIEVAGKVKGRIEADEVIVLPGGLVEGDAICRLVVVAGTLTGAISAQEVQIRDNGRVDATIETTLISVDAAACLEGQVRRLRMG